MTTRLEEVSAMGVPFGSCGDAAQIVAKCPPSTACGRRVEPRGAKPASGMSKRTPLRCSVPSLADFACHKARRDPRIDKCNQIANLRVTAATRGLGASPPARHGRRCHQPTCRRQLQGGAAVGHCATRADKSDNLVIVHRVSKGHDLITLDAVMVHEQRDARRLDTPGCIASI